MSAVLLVTDGWVLPPRFPFQSAGRESSPTSKGKTNNLKNCGSSCAGKNDRPIIPSFRWPSWHEGSKPSGHFHPSAPSQLTAPSSAPETGVVLVQGSCPECWEEGRAGQAGLREPGAIVAA